MSIPSKTILSANGIIKSSEEPNDLYCSICPTEQFSGDWQEHLSNPTHIGALQRFDTFFERKGLKVSCKLCTSHFFFGTLKNHAKWHKIVPWYQPENLFETFVENQILEWENQFFCFLCDAYFPQWFAAFFHVTEQKHYQKFKAETPPDEALSLSRTISSSKFLVSNGLFPRTATTARCRICRSDSINLSSVTQHVNGRRHKNLKLQLIIEILKKKDKSETCKMNVLDCSTRANESQMKQSDSNVSLNDHQNKDIEQKACKMKQSDANVSLNDHQNKDIEQKACEMKQSNANVSLTNLENNISTEKKACEYIVELEDTKWCCKICDCNIAGSVKNTEQHRAGKAHRKALEKYGCDKIVHKKDEMYHCSCCNCELPGFESVYSHLKGKRHLDCLDRLHQSSAEIETASSPEVRSNIPNWNLPYNVVKKSGEEASWCRICETQPIGSEFINSHFTGEEHRKALEKYGCDKIVHKKDEMYHCSCCNCELPGFESVYGHLKGKRHLRCLDTLHQSSAKTETGEEAHSCRICETELADSESINSHLTRKEHQEALEKYGFNEIFHKKDETYHCGCCNCDLSSEESVYNHVKKKKHLDFLTKLQQSSGKIGTASSLKVASDILHWTLPCNAVKESGEDASCCRICETQLIGSESINSHLTGKPHENALRSYGFDKISVKGSQYYCSRCKCQVPGLNNVYLHVKGYNHSVVNREVQTSTKNANETIAINQSELQTTKKRRTRKPRSKPKRKNHKPIVFTICSVCNISVANSEELHIHLLTHFAEFDPEDYNNQGPNETPKKKFNETVESESFDSLPSSQSSKNLLNPVLKNNNIAKTLQIDVDHIYDMQDKLKEIELSIKLSFMIDSQSIYCLICQQNIASSWDDYYEHLCSNAHCEYLDEMKNDHELFKLVPEQFSALDLASQYMEEISDDAVRCMICDAEINNSESALKDHIEKDGHEQECKKLHEIAKKHYERMKLRRKCDWYNVNKYSCVPCTMTTENEASFVAHLTGSKHESVIEKLENTRDRLIYDFCVSCALLWYGPRSTYAEHCEKNLHTWLKRDGHYLTSDLPLLAKSLLEAREEFVEKEIGSLLSADECEKEKALISNLEKAVRAEFRNAKVYPFGSRVSGVGSPDSDIDVFLDCGAGRMYNGRKILKDEILKIMTEVQKCLGKNSESWVVKEFLPNCRSPLLKVYHRSTGISCDISFENGLSVENTKLIKSFIDAYPMARKMMLFLKRWLKNCELAGSDRITSYALYWLVIFYLQKECILPSVGTLIEKKNKSQIIAGWEVGVSHAFTYHGAESLTLDKLLKTFFEFYANFDYRNDVAAPIIGDTVTKWAFAKMEKLPKEMAPYIAKMKNSPKAEGYRVDSPMSIQDPFDLGHNITKAVNKVVLNSFRTYCSKSLDVICALEFSHVAHLSQTKEREQEELKDFVIL